MNNSIFYDEPRQTRRNVRARHFPPVYHIPFLIIQIICSYLSTDSINGGDGSHDIDWSWATSVVSINKSLFVSLRAYYISIKCPIESRRLIIPTLTTCHINIEHFYNLVVCLNELPAFAHLVWMVGRNVYNSQRRLCDDTYLSREISMARAELSMRNKLDELSYEAAHAIRVRIKNLLHPLTLPMHAQETHVRQLLQLLNIKEIPEIIFLVQWLRTHGEHVAYGRVCLSVICNENHFCSGARARIIPRRYYHHPVDNTNDDRGVTSLCMMRNGDVSELIPSLSNAATALDKITIHSLPRVILRSIMEDYISFIDIDTLEAIHFTSHTLRDILVESSHLHSIVVHRTITKKINKLTQSRFILRKQLHMTWQAPCSQTNDQYSHLLRKMLYAYRSYSIAFSGMCDIQIQNSDDEKNELIKKFVTDTQKLLNSPGRDMQQKLIKSLHDMDYRLMEFFAVDMLDMEELAVHALPPRAFYSGSKHRKRFRREITEPSPGTIHPGARKLYRIQCIREDLRQWRATMLRSIRELEAFEVSTTQRLMEELRDSGFIYGPIRHACSILSSSCNSLLTYVELNSITQKMVSDAEKHHHDHDHSAWYNIFTVASMIRHMIASKIQGIQDAILIDTPTPLYGDEINDFNNWRIYLDNVSAEKTGKRIIMRIVTKIDNDHHIIDGFSIYYEHRKGSNGMNTKQADNNRTDLITALPLHYLAIYGHQNRLHHRNGISDADVLIVWGDKERGKNTVILVRPHARDTFNAFLESENNLIGTLERHGQLTGKCAPCGRPLRHKDIWIGSTCLGHLPQGDGSGSSSSSRVPRSATHNKQSYEYNNICGGGEENEDNHYSFW